MGWARALALCAALVVVFAAGCGDTVRDSPPWSCSEQALKMRCECASGDAGMTPGYVAVASCAGYACCYASSDHCTCFTVEGLTTDCALFQVEGKAPVASCPPK